MEDKFKVFHGDELTPGHGIVSKMLNILKDVPEEVMFFFFPLHVESTLE